MGKLKALIILAIVLLVSLVFGFFLIQNDHDVLVDVLYQTEPVKLSVASLSIWLFGTGLLIGIGLAVTSTMLTAIELRAARRESRRLSKQLTNLQERSLKDSG